MSLLEATCARIREPDAHIAVEMQRLLDDKTKPRGSLGRLEEIACQVAAIRGSLSAEPPRKAVVVCDSLSAFDLLTTVGVAFPAAVVTEVPGLLRWATDGERALVDGKHGLVSLNPKRSEVEAFRAARRPEGPAD